MVNNKNQFNFENEIIFDKIKNILDYIFKKKRFNSDSDSEFDSEFDSGYDSDSEFDSESELNKFLKFQNSKKSGKSGKSNESNGSKSNESNGSKSNESNGSKSNESNCSKKSTISYSNEKITPNDLYLEIKYQLHKKQFIIKYNNKVRNLKFFFKKTGLSLSKFISEYTDFKIIKEDNKLYITA
jgi:hypothetical protein